MTTTNTALQEVALRIRELREISGYSLQEMAKRTGVTTDDYLRYEAGAADMPFTFIHNCAQTFGVEISNLMEGHSPKLRSYTVTRRGEGEVTARERGIEIRGLASSFRKKLAEPYFVRYEYEEDQQALPIPVTSHGGHEFDIVISGMLKVQIGSHVETLYEGDSIYYDSAQPHGMRAVGGKDCTFCAVVLSGEETAPTPMAEPIVQRAPETPAVYRHFIDVTENDAGALLKYQFKDLSRFNFAFDVMDRLAADKPDDLALMHIADDLTERPFTYNELRRASNKTANFLRSIGVKKGDRVLVVLRRHYQFWFTMLALHKLGAIGIPATDQLLQHDFEYRFNAAEVSAVVCTNLGKAAGHIEDALQASPTVKTLVMCGGSREGWHDFDTESQMYSSNFQRGEDTPCGEDPMVMFFTSGTTGYPKLVTHNYQYPLAHFFTAKYWHCNMPGKLHLTISDTGWAKSMWGKMYGQWLCEAPIFVYDFDRFNANSILPMFKKYDIATFCAPPTIYRFLIKEDLSKFDLSSIRHATIAGEALNPEVFEQFKKATGLSLMEGFGQTETTLMIANTVGMTPKIGSMGKPMPLYPVDVVDNDGASVKDGETGEIVIRVGDEKPVGLFGGYYRDNAVVSAVENGLYHTGDTAWRDEDGYYWYVGRKDDLIKSSGYRIGPFEIESVIMELPYVLECGVSPAPDPVRGQIVKASIVLTKGTEPTEELKKEIQAYVKQHTAPYKYPRIIVFREELPKTISGKIQRNQL